MQFSWSIKQNIEIILENATKNKQYRLKLVFFTDKPLNKHEKKSFKVLECS